MTPRRFPYDARRLLFLIVLSFVSAQKLLFQHSSLFFAPLAFVVVSDDSERCRKMAAMAIKALLAKLDLNHQNTLFSFVNAWLNAEKVPRPHL